MKVFNLACHLGHHFEGWFASSDDYESQLAAQCLQCPVCDSPEIRRLPSAPRLNLGAIEPAQLQNTEAQHQADMLNQARALLASTEDVGARFAEEARRIHYGEGPERAIRGVASDEERRELEEEGIAVLRIGVPHALKEPLQ